LLLVVTFFANIILEQLGEHFNRSISNQSLAQPLRIYSTIRTSSNTAKITWMTALSGDEGAERGNDKKRKAANNQPRNVGAVL